MDERMVAQQKRGEKKHFCFFWYSIQGPGQQTRWWLHELISPFSGLNYDQLWQLFFLASTSLLPLVIYNLDFGITAKYSKQQAQWREQLLRMFGPVLIQINWLINQIIKTARSAVSRNCAERGFLRAIFFFAESVAKFWKHDISSASERAFLGVFGDIFGCSTLSKKRCFSTQESTRFLSTVSLQRWAVISRIWEKLRQTSSGLGTG